VEILTRARFTKPARSLRPGRFARALFAKTCQVSKTWQVYKMWQVYAKSYCLLSVLSRSTFVLSWSGRPVVIFAEPTVPLVADWSSGFAVIDLVLSQEATAKTTKQVKTIDFIKCLV